MEINKDALLIKMAEREFSRQKLAEVSGVTYAQLSEAMRRGRMTTESLGRVAHALGCEVKELVEV